jgi:hypothetical protein
MPRSLYWLLLSINGLCLVVNVWLVFYGTKPWLSGIASLCSVAAITYFVWNPRRTKESQYDPR